MTQRIFIVIGMSVLSACGFHKTTEVSIVNHNHYPISITVKTNNIHQTFADIPAGGEKRAEYDWTDIEKKDGQWIFFVTNNTHGSTDTFAHGFYTQGELAGFAEIESEGPQLKVRISE